MSEYSDIVDRGGSFKKNQVLLINGTYFSAHSPDSGLVVPKENQILEKLSVPPIQIDLADSRSSIGGISFSILDKDGVFTAFKNSGKYQLIGSPIQIFDGYVDESLDFSEYKDLGTYYISSDSFNGLTYSIKADSPERKLQRSAFNQKGNLTNEVLETEETSISFSSENAAFFEEVNIVRIKDEFIEYSSVNVVGNDVTLSGLFRGLLSSKVESYDIGEEVFAVYKAEGNPIDIALSMMVSSGGGGGEFDSFPDGAAVPSSLVDIAEIVALRDEFFSGQTYQFYISNIGDEGESKDVLKWLEENIFLSTNTRFVKSSGGKLRISLLNRPPTTFESIPTVGDNENTAIPRISSSQSDVKNILVINWDYSDGRGTYRQTNIFKDDESRAVFGDKTRTISFKGIKSELLGIDVIRNFQNQYLNRFSSPKQKINVSDIFTKSGVEVGGVVNFSSKFLPSNGNVGGSTTAEVLQSNIKYDSAIIDFVLSYNSFSGERLGLIAPAQNITGNTGQNIIEVENISLFSVGQVCSIYNKNSDFLYDEINTIKSITGNIITFENDWSTVSFGAGDYGEDFNNDFSSGSRLMLKFASYDDCTEQQKDEFAFICDSTSVFKDGRVCYKISL